MEIDANGYAALTMEAIVRRTSLSKGGVYRFFSNKKEIALALFEYIYQQIFPYDAEELLSWNLSISETIVNSIFTKHSGPGNEEYLLVSRIWLHMLPETMNDADFLRVSTEFDDKISLIIEDFIEHKSRLEKIRLNVKKRASIRKAIQVGHTLVLGLMLEKLAGKTEEELIEKIRFFIEQNIKDALESNVKDRKR